MYPCAFFIKVLIIVHVILDQPSNLDKNEDMNVLRDITMSVPPPTLCNSKDISNNESVTISDSSFQDNQDQIINLNPTINIETLSDVKLKCFLYQYDHKEGSLRPIQ